MSSIGKGLVDCLSRQDMKLHNIKFFRGSNATISKDQLLEEACAAAARKISGEVKPKAMPKWRTGKVNLHERVAKL